MSLANRKALLLCLAVVPLIAGCHRVRLGVASPPLLSPNNVALVAINRTHSGPFIMASPEDVTIRIRYSVASDKLLKLDFVHFSTPNRCIIGGHLHMSYMPHSVEPTDGKDIMLHKGNGVISIIARWPGTDPVLDAIPSGSVSLQARLVPQKGSDQDAKLITFFGEYCTPFD